MTRTSKGYTSPTDADKEQALYDFWKFLDIINFHGGSKNFGQCHRDLINWDEDNWASDNKLILMPRGHLKSTLLTVGRALHRIYQIPDIRIFVGTATRELAGAFVREIRTYLESEILQEYVWNNRPHVAGRLIPEMERTRYRRDLGNDSRDKKVIWSTKAIQVIRPTIMKEPTVTVGSVGTIPTGFHFDEMYLDDVVNYDNINTPDKRTRLINWVDDLRCVLDPKYFDQRWYEMLPDQAKKYCYLGGRFVVVGTRYDRYDWYGDIIEGTGEGDADGDLAEYPEDDWAIYQKNIYQNGKDRSNGYLWYEVWDEKIELKRRRNMTPTRFASQYLNMIIAPGSSVLNYDLINWLAPYQYDWEVIGASVKITHNAIPAGYEIIKPIMVVDPAATVGDDSDYTAIMVGGKSGSGRVYILDALMGKYTSEQILTNIYKLADKWKLRGVWIESVGGFAHFVEYVRAAFPRFRPLVLHEYKPTWTQGKKEVRISNALEPLIENGLLFMPFFLKSNTEIRDQIVFFPRKTIHDDFPDCLAALAELAKAPVKKTSNPLRVHYNKIYGGYR